MKIGLIVCVLGLCACQSLSTKQDLHQILGTRIEWPANLTCLINGKDTLIPNYLNADVKLIVYYDSTQCSSCRIQRLYEWQDMMTLSRALRSRFNVCFVVVPKAGETERVRNAVTGVRLNYPVFMDREGDFLRMNPSLMAKDMYHVFLLDRDNQVILVGNPLENPKLWELYTHEIKTRAHQLPVASEQTE